jgi:hypothetical protein
LSGSLTVIGGHSSTQGLTGLVTVPSGFTGSVLTGLQALLTSASGAVSTNSANFENLNAAGVSGAETATVRSATLPGVLDITNYNSVNATVAGAASVSVSVPSGYNTLVVEAPGHETLTGNGGDFLAVFGSQSSVNFNAAGGSGTVYASGNDSTSLSGPASFFVGGSGGANSVNASGASVTVTLTGAGNSLLTTAQNASILSAGSSDIISTSGSGAAAHITVTGNATIDNTGASDTIAATGSGAFSAMFSGSAGGQVDFINSSGGASSILANLNVATGAISSAGSVTVSAGAGGGVYDGGVSGNNSLVGGSGVVTLFSAGITNYLYANGAETGTAYNLLNAYSGGNDTLIAGSGSTNNTFFAGIGTESILSYGSGTQNFFVGTEGSETIYGSTATGANNVFIFQQSTAQGGGTDVLINFKPGEGYINLGSGSNSVNIVSYENLSGAHSGTEIDLSNGTTVKIFGVAASSFSSSMIGGTHF